MAGIAKAADVSTATLYKHYANKETLFEAVVATASAASTPPFRPTTLTRTYRWKKASS